MCQILVLTILNVYKRYKVIIYSNGNSPTKAISIDRYLYTIGCTINNNYSFNQIAKKIPKL